MSLLRLGSVVVALVLASAASAAQIEEHCKNHYILDDCPIGAPKSSTFRFTQVFSSPSGQAQLIQIVEMDGADGQHRLGGLVLVATNRFGEVRRFMIPHDLPNDRTAHRAVVFATYADGDYVIPPRFVPTDGGTLELVGVDRWAIEPLPRDGVHALARYLLPPGPATQAPFFQGYDDAWRAAFVVQDEVVEYHDAASDRYFMTILGAESQALDVGRVPGFVRTGESFLAAINRYQDPYGALDPPPADLQPVCRLFLPPPDGPEHFYSASADECDSALRNIPGMVLETREAFLAALPDVATGACAANTVPLFRLWNRDARGVSHRFVARKSTRDALVASGWVSEGWGPDGVAMCTDTRRNWWG